MIGKVEQRILLEIYSGKYNTGIPMSNKTTVSIVGYKYHAFNIDLVKEGGFHKRRIGELLKNLEKHKMVEIFTRDKICTMYALHTKTKLCNVHFLLKSLFPSMRYPNTRIIGLTEFGVKFAQLLAENEK